MRRAEIMQAVQVVLNAISSSKILTTFEESMHDTRGEREAFNASLMSALHGYSLLASGYGPIERRIAEIVGLAELTDPQKWSDVVYIKDRTVEKVYKWYRALDFAVDYLPVFLKLIEPDYLTITEKGPEELPDEYKDKALLTTILIEDSNHPPTTDRVVDLVSSISSLYEASSTILKHSNVPLTIIGCDSGGEKAFDFFGAAKIIQMVKEIILSLWDRIVFFRTLQITQRLEAVAKSLPVIDQIADLEKEEKIGHEEAELLRRNIIGSVQRLINCGAVIPEMKERSTFDPHELMMPEPKLLEEGVTKGASEEPKLKVKKKRKKQIE